MHSFTDYSTCEGSYPWLGAKDCTGGSYTWVDGSAWVRRFSRVDESHNSTTCGECVNRADFMAVLLVLVLDGLHFEVLDRFDSGWVWDPRSPSTLW